MSAKDRDGLKVFAGRASRDLGRRICEHLELPPGQSRTEMFADGEIIMKVVSPETTRHTIHK